MILLFIFGIPFLIWIIEKNEYSQIKTSQKRHLKKLSKKYYICKMIVDQMEENKPYDILDLQCKIPICENLLDEIIQKEMENALHMGFIQITTTTIKTLSGTTVNTTYTKI